ncbi:VQ motif-containing protein 11 [Linum perenne]
METETSRRHVAPNSNSLLPPMSPVSTTTFVQADAATFRDLVQKLTGAPADSDTKLPVTTRTHAPKPTNNIISINSYHSTSSRRSPYRLQERRQTMRKLEIKLSRASLRTSPCSSPYSQMASPVTPLMGSPFFSSAETSPSPSPSTEEEEERAIADKRFYLHPSPRGNVDPPELLPLFPLTSPAVEIDLLL